MSEKQFKLSSETVLQYQIMNNDTDLNENEVVDLLNEQQATIHSLKEEVRLLKPTNIEQYEQIVQLQKENEQLKEEYKIAIDEMVTDYKKLEKENEQLRILLKNIYVDDELRKLAERYGVENE